MQTVSDQFNSYARSNHRPLAYKVSMSFIKDFNSSVTFFTIGSSLIGGADFIKPDFSDVVQEWDKYTYTDYSDRVISIEWQTQVDPIISVTQAMADVVFNNYDDFFTPNGSSSISSYILPHRPIRIYAGFGNEVIPVFIGITEKMPVIDEKAKTATFHCIDFMESLMDRSLDESVLYQNKRTDEILLSLLQLVGLSSVQVSLDGSFTTIPFKAYDKGTKFGDALKDLMTVEIGRIYMDEYGVIHFKNRQDYSATSRYSFNAYENIVDARKRTEDDLINVVEVKGNVKAVQTSQSSFDLSESVKVPASGTVDIWADFQSPITSVTAPVYIDSATTSSFSVNTLSDGSGLADSTSVTLTSSSLLGKSYKMTFTNSSGGDLYITTLNLYATPVFDIKPIYVREEDTTSTDKYEEHVLRLENDLFQDEDIATSKAKIILHDFASLNAVSEIEVKGNMALQLDDTVSVNIFNLLQTSKITGITNKLTFPAKFTQILRLKTFTPTNYFTIGSSVIGGTDVIAP